MFFIPILLLCMFTQWCRFLLSFSCNLFFSLFLLYFYIQSTPFDFHCFSFFLLFHPSYSTTIYSVTDEASEKVRGEKVSWTLGNIGRKRGEGKDLRLSASDGWREEKEAERKRKKEGEKKEMLERGKEGRKGLLDSWSSLDHHLTFIFLFSFLFFLLRLVWKKSPNPFTPRSLSSLPLSFFSCNFLKTFLLQAHFNTLPFFHFNVPDKKFQ